MIRSSAAQIPVAAKKVKVTSIHHHAAALAKTVSLRLLHTMPDEKGITFLITLIKHEKYIKQSEKQLPRLAT